MSVASGSPPKGVDQPATFAFTPENQARVREIIAKYPEGRQQSAVMPLLDLAQRQHDNWLPLAAMDHVAEILEIPPVRVYEVATFYTMYNRAPVGRNFVQVCTTTPCWLCGSDEVLRACRDELGIGPGETTADGAFTVVEVECQGACVNALMLTLDDEYFEDLDNDRTVAMLRGLKTGERPVAGPQSARRSSEPAGGATTLKTAAKGGGADA